MTAPIFAATAVTPTVEPLEVTASNSSGNASGFAACGNVSTSSGPSVSVTGGREPYSYQWTQTGGAATNGPFAISSATVANPSWSDLRCGNDADNNENWELEVTDDDGRTDTATISVSLIWIDLN